MAPAPPPIALGRWLLAAGLALVTGVLLFLLYASGRLPLLLASNVWVLTGFPLLVWLLAFAARAYVYGGAVNHHQFLEEQGQIAQHAWQQWAHRHLAVHACCVLLPDQVSARVLAEGPVDLPSRAGEARRIAALAQQQEPALAGLELLLSALVPSLKAFPAEQALRVTLLSDAKFELHAALRGAWQQHWASAVGRPPPASVTVAAELPVTWIDEIQKTASAAIELVLVLQTQGGTAYSDGLAALLFCPDQLARKWGLPVQGHLLRPMPLETDRLESELSLFFQTQTDACQATGLLADSAAWQPVAGELFAAGRVHGTSLNPPLWIQERWCGLSGPFSHWLVAALAVEVVRHHRQPLLVLAQEGTRGWIGTVTAGESA